MQDFPHTTESDQAFRKNKQILSNLVIQLGECTTVEFSYMVSGATHTQVDSYNKTFDALDKMVLDFNTSLYNAKNNNDLENAVSDFSSQLQMNLREKVMDFHLQKRVFWTTCMLGLCLSAAAGTVSGLYMPMAINVPSAANVAIAIGVGLFALCLSAWLLPKVSRKLLDFQPEPGSAKEDNMIKEYQEYYDVSSVNEIRCEGDAACLMLKLLNNTTLQKNISKEAAAPL